MYQLENILNAATNPDVSNNVHVIKRLVKTAIWEYEYTSWRACQLLYPELESYYEVTLDMKFHTWWKIAQKWPCLTSKISCIMSLLFGCQPKTLQRNFDSKFCKLCTNQHIENAQHILFECSAYESVRSLEWANVLKTMPKAMAEQPTQFPNNERLKAILSCLSGSVIDEWKSVYMAIADYVYKICVSRAQHYDELYVVT